MNKLIICITGLHLAACSIPAVAQYSNAVWILGGGYAIDFASGTPSVLSGFHQHTHGHPGTAISDQAGNLLFYAATHQLYNGSHDTIPNGDSLFGHPQSYGGLVIPQGSVPGKFFTFRYPSPLIDPTLYWDEVDLLALGGAGWVNRKNQILMADAIEAFVAIPGYQPGTYWFVTHRHGTDEWLSFQVNDIGLDTVAMVSNSGEPHWQGLNTTRRGQMKVSPLGTKIALGKNRFGNFDWRLELYDFDPSTGIVSNPVRLADSLGWFGMEFSPSGQYLYAGERGCSAGFLSKVFQYDISSGDSATIVNSKQLVSTHVVQQGCVTAHGEMLLGPDGKIYVARTLDLMLDVIEFPDMAGIACGYNAAGLHLGHESPSILPRQMHFSNETSVGLNTHERAQPRLHPNPFHTTARLHLPRAPQSAVMLRWHDAQGRLLHQERLPAQQVQELDRGTLPTGLLLLSASDEHGTLARLKVVVE